MSSRKHCNIVRSVTQPSRHLGYVLSRCIRSAMVIVCLTATAQIVLADGLLDPTFAGDGRASYPFDAAGSNRADVGCSAVVQSGGRVVVGGLAANADGFPRLAFVRLLPDGTTDPTFGAGGSTVLTSVPYAVYTCPRAAVQPDDKILVAGTAVVGSTNIDAFMIRLTADGALDPTFSSDGMLLTSALDAGLAILPHPDGTIWVAGVAANVFKILRMTTTGVNLGQLEIQFVGAGTETALALGIQPDGKVLACGFATYSGLDIDFAVARLTPTLELDPTFNGTGKRTVPFDLGTEKSDRCSGIGVDSAGRIVVAGSASSTVAGRYSFAVARLLENGDLDPSFGNVGQAVVQAPLFNDEYDNLPRLLVQSDLKVVLASSISTGDSSNTSDAIVYRLTASGVPDTTFGEGFGGIVFDMAPDGPGVEADRVTSLTGYGAHPFVVGSGEYNAPDTDFSAARLTSLLIFANGFDDGSSWWWSASSP